MGRFEISAAARADILEIGRYTEMTFGRNRRYEYLGRLNRAFERLARFPGLGKSIDRIRQGMFQHAVGRHLVFYRVVEGGGVLIIRVLHQSMDVAREL